MQCASLVAFAIVAVGVGTVERTHAAHVDMMLFQEAGQLRLGGYDFFQREPLASLRVFPSPMTVFPGHPGVAYTDNPGWATAPADRLGLLPDGAKSLPAGASISFDIVPSAITGVNLSHWDGAGPVAFGPPPADEVLVYGGFFFDTGAVADGSISTVPGFEIATTSGMGDLHTHLDFSVYGNASLQPVPVDEPTPGVYLVEMAGRVEGLVGNPSAHVLLGIHTDEATLAAAEQWVSAQLVPEPSAAVLAFVCLAASVRGSTSVRLTSASSERRGRPR